MIVSIWMEIFHDKLIFSMQKFQRIPGTHDSFPLDKQWINYAITIVLVKKKEIHLCHYRHDFSISEVEMIETLANG